MIRGPDSKYMMQYRGDWRPVVNMFTHANSPTAVAERCVKAVLFVDSDYWVATVVNPGDLVERLDRNPNLRDWEYVSD